ncbi:N-Dimethylarginine dimethylaminohydrolase [Clostridium sp. DSM 8431]|uniref:dimethylarginine dimethylaminohydrolase family protein n=1 Tax=Clostridium sp. DSM 8431 TaxID=1761781 RepID=UPI0008EF28CA|nr:arginine deiminase family protein [Clostridium sp. DSM 8431]SFU66121.1 N-Dimethylarginine dimethylaminohydrolase [Clostridium sp. DSM 8431]
MIKSVDSAHGGAGWRPRKTTSIDELGTIWRQCGVVSETDELKEVLMRRPGKEILKVDNPSKYLWTKKMDLEKAQFQHDNIAETYRKLGVKVNYIDDIRAEKYPNIIFMRDTFTMTSQGAIVSRLASEARTGEEVIVAEKLSSLGIPIIATAHGEMNLEGPDIILVNKDLVFLGIGIRTNMKAVQFVKILLEMQGYTDIKIIQTTYGCGHLDGVVNILNSKYAALVPQRASYEMYQSLKRHGYKIIDLDNITEVDQCMSINFVPINQETIVMNKGTKDTIKKYQDCGIECIEVDVSELMNGGGAIHCMTGVIERK